MTIDKIFNPAYHYKFYRTFPVFYLLGVGQIAIFYSIAPAFRSGYK